ncbi:MAG: hypothetical protein ABIH46_11025 [Chloroflexota bacterium]
MNNPGGRLYVSHPKSCLCCHGQPVEIDLDWLTRTGNLLINHKRQVWYSLRLLGLTEERVKELLRQGDVYLSPEHEPVVR